MGARIYVCTSSGGGANDLRMSVGNRDKYLLCFFGGRDKDLLCSI